jgi:hypothetical protein
MACVITSVGLNGYNNDGLGRPSELFLYARVTGTCTLVRLELRLSPNGIVVFSATVPVDTNGSASASYFPQPVIYPCGHSFWMTATCASGSDCSAAGWIGLVCKSGSPGSPGGPGTPGNPPGSGPGDNGNGGTGDWPWPSPPHIFCPMIGRVFTVMFAAGLAVVVLGVWMLSPPLVASGVALIAAAFAMLAIWQIWCVPPPCYVVGAILWGLKRATVGALGIGLVLFSVPTLILALLLGIASGMATAYLRKRRCFLPKLTTPLANLPLW